MTFRQRIVKEQASSMLHIGTFSMFTFILRYLSRLYNEYFHASQPKRHTFKIHQPFIDMNTTSTI
ncbi:hypothetical protein M431DRAFT_421622 [Trichoderma harzianum CBS 226.95]|uniref:Uncharacterized protein n=1 Tax=Trichoderma harzianum CBS 226.95 TaxID=983964 RepID=A0A2T4ABM1_TRIHA|nr:hypothetical protein M431DRAFT_421622 [Trichoderma harzianum CBS 226.95]PTB54467.1 hypothetical protein M431DRAFT_421622 [Trichoderma harzianum CBS 226.95]